MTILAISGSLRRDSHNTALLRAARDLAPAGVVVELYESQGKPELAKKIYAQLKDKDAKGPAGMMAAQKLNPAPAGPGGQ